MKRAFIVCAFLLLGGATIPSSGQAWKDDQTFIAFWQKFKAAVMTGDKQAVIALSSFPIRMPGRVRAIRDATDLKVRYQEVFSKRTNAAKCFARSDSDPVGQPEGGHPKEFAVFCDLGTGDWVVYTLKLTKVGWRFTRFSQQQQLD